MVVIVGEFTAATLAANVDIFDIEPFVNYKMAKRARRVRSVGIVGGADEFKEIPLFSLSADDLQLDLYYGTRLVASKLYNVATGLTNATDMQIPIVGGDWCRVDEPIKLVVTDAGNTNPYNIKVTIS